MGLVERGRGGTSGLSSLRAQLLGPPPHYLTASCTFSPQLPKDYYKEWVRGPYALIAGATLGAYLFHPFMQAGAALVQNTGLKPGGLLG